MVEQINQSWVEQHKELLLKILEADYDPHLKRIAPKSLQWVKCSALQNEATLIEFTTLVLEYGGCSGVSHETIQTRRIKMIAGESELESRLIALL